MDGQTVPEPDRGDADIMPRLHETLDTPLSPDETFAFVADFANARLWDPGVATSEREGPPGPVRLGTRYRLGVRMRGRVAPIVYEVTTWDPPQRVVLTGDGSNVHAIDDIRFGPRPDGTGTRIDYIADIRLTGWLRLLEPFAGGAFRKIAADAVGGMQRALDARARVAAS
jgi:carbon monoxide dehydrogenase subunit G